MHDTGGRGRPRSRGRARRGALRRDADPWQPGPHARHRAAGVLARRDGVQHRHRAAAVRRERRHLFTYALDEGRLIFLISSGVVWAAVVGVIALVGRLWISVGLCTAAAVVVGFASYEKTTLRREPIYPSDLAFAGQAGFLREMVGPAPLLIVLLDRGPGPARVRPRGSARGPGLPPDPPPGRAGTLARPARRPAGGPAPRRPDLRLGRPVQRPRQRAARRLRTRRGALGLLVPGGELRPERLRRRLPLQPPRPGHDRSPRTTASRRWPTSPASTPRSPTRLNVGRSGDAFDDVNIVLVLSEAFSDPTTIDGPTYDEDPIPFTRSLMQRTRSGTMLPQLFGGGTANMEFETLTGMSLSQFLPQMNTPYQQLVTETPTFPSVVGYLRQLGHRPIGIHPYMTTMYKRYAVYPTLGFDAFIDDAHMQHTERIGEDAFISDASSFDEVLYQLEQSDEPELVNLVTMQNHYPMAGRYDDPVPVEGVSGEVADQLSGYLRGLELTDAALQGVPRLAAPVRREDRRRHVRRPRPRVLGRRRLRRQRRRRVPADAVLHVDELQAPARTPQALTSHQPDLLPPTLFDELDAPLPPYYALLRELQDEIRRWSRASISSRTGRGSPEDELGARAQELLHDYRLVQYDLAVGERYSPGGDVLPGATDFGTPGRGLPASRFRHGRR